MKKKSYLIIAILIILPLIMGLFWLSIAIASLFLLYIVKQFLIGLIAVNPIKKTVNTLFSFALIVIITIAVRVFVADIYLIPSSSMENTLYPKDVILVNKLTYGPSLPKSPYEIPWINIFYYLKDSSKKAIAQKKWPEKRLSGTSEVKQGDVIVFKRFDKGMFLVKRCVATPGDTLTIIDGKIWNSKIKKDMVTNIRNTYEFKMNDIDKFEFQLDSLKLNIEALESRNSHDNWMKAKLSSQEFQLLKSFTSIDSIQQKIETKSIKANMFPWYKKKNWTLDNYGPLIIPKKGMTIKLNHDTFNFYQKILKNYEKVFLKRKNGKFYIKDNLVTTYTFKKDYLFMMGDNRHESYDSRYFGMTPKAKVIGKVQCVLFSNKDDTFQWNRLFKGV